LLHLFNVHFLGVLLHYNVDYVYFTECVCVVVLAQ
jgi:hypothetical protein